MRMNGFAASALLGTGLVIGLGSAKAQAVQEYTDVWENSYGVRGEVALDESAAYPYEASVVQWRSYGRQPSGRYYQRYPDQHYSRWSYRSTPRYRTWHRYPSDPTIWRHNIYGYDGRYYGRHSPYDWRYDRYRYRDRDRGFYFGFSW
jgi:hypothetical protein